MILLITFMEVPVVTGVDMFTELTKVPDVTVLSTLTGPANPEDV